MKKRMMIALACVVCASVLAADQLYTVINGSKSTEKTYTAKMTDSGSPLTVSPATLKVPPGKTNHFKISLSTTVGSHTNTLVVDGLQGGKKTYTVIGKNGEISWKRAN